MVLWQSVMWWRLTLTLLLASIASSSSSGSDSDNKNKSNRSTAGSTCPESCRCTRIQPVETVNNNSTNNNVNNRKLSTEIHCEGRMPAVESLPSDARRLVVEKTKPEEIINMLKVNSLSVNGINDEGSEPLDRQLADSNNIFLQELAFINCSLKRLNISLITVSILGKSLNLSVNEFTDTSALTVRDSDRLERLDLSRNHLSRLRSEAFAAFSGLMLLNLRENEIEVVEERGFAGMGSLESLDLSENRLLTLVDGAFSPLTLLQKLDLSGNKLVGVLGGGHQWFDGLERLKELDVSRNGEDINVSGNKEARGRHVALESLPIGLKILRLAENPLTDVELSLVLGSGRRLETVDASRIGLDRVPSALTRSVQALILSGNRLRSIRSGDFDGYPLLRVLDISSNIVNNVEEDAFGRLENLERLDLSNNRLTEIPESLPSSLLYLLLSHNSIERLTARDLQGIPKLQKLAIDNNAIKEIELGCLNQLGLLLELDISDNPIKQLPANTFSGPRFLAEVRMSGLASLEWDREKRADMAFPVPAPERLVTLDLSRSPALAAQLLADEAALSACKSLRLLNLSKTNITALRSDLAYLLPQLHTLGLSDNEWNCTSDNSEDILWLAEWIKQHEEIQPPGKCDTAKLRGHTISSGNNGLPLRELTSYYLGLDSHPISIESRSSSNFTIGSGSIKTSKKDRNTTNAEAESFSLDKNSRTVYREKLLTLMTKSLPYNNRNIIDTAIITSNSPASDIDKVTKLQNSSAANKYSILVTEAKDTIETSDINVKESINSTTSQRNELDDNNHYSFNTSRGIITSSTKSTVLDRNSESINDTLAEELIGREEATKTLPRTADPTLTSTIGAHPAILVIVGAALGAIVALSVVISRRTTFANDSRMHSLVLLNRENYHRQENIEIQSFGHQQPIVTDLW